jgi:glycosyltransferase involved in cell wall biosynthesis
MLYLNVRFLEEELSGVGRFSIEVTKRLVKLLPDSTCIAPKKLKNTFGLVITRKGNKGGAFWEQLVAPFLSPSKNDWWFNPGNTCPLFIKNNITCVHDIIPLTNPEWYSFQARTYYNILMPLVIKKSKVIITGSNFTKLEIQKKTNTPLDKIHVIPYAVDKFWQPSAEKPDHENYILTVASFDPRKNLKGLIKAFRHLEDKTLKLIIVGHKHKAFASQDLELSESDRERIVFTGYLDDEKVRSLYTHAKAFVYPSLKEGFGIPPLEAMACGCPVIASNASSIPEVCGDAVVYVNPLDTQSITFGIESVLSNKELSSNLIEKGFRQVQLFSWDITAEKIAELIKRSTQK